MNWHRQATTVIRRAFSKRNTQRSRRRTSRIEGYLQFRAIEPLEHRMMLSASLNLVPDAGDGAITVENGVTVIEVPAGGVTIDIIAQLSATTEPINAFQLDFAGSTVAAGQLELSNWTTNGAWTENDGTLGAADFDVDGGSFGGIAVPTDLGTFSVTIPATPGDYRLDLGPGGGTALLTGIFPPSNVMIDDFGDLIIRVPGAVVPTISVSDVVVVEGDNSLPLTTTIAGTVRDFIGDGTTSVNQGSAVSHPDFENSSFLGYRISNPGTIDVGLVGPTLGGDGNPTFASAGSTLTGSTEFNQWYNNDATVNMDAPLTLTLEQGEDASRFVYNGTDGNGNFYPIDNQLFGNTQGADILGAPVDADHNWDFTYEAHSTFVYQAGQTITINSDDDFWLFIDGELVLDRGGVNIDIARTVEIDDLGLTPGQTYTFDMFYAERHTTDAVLTIDTDILLGVAAANIPNYAEFTVSLSEATTNAVTVDFSTLDATAVAGSDYLPSSGTVTFAAGETSKTVRVPLIGDGFDETDETFLLNLANPVNATLADSQGSATITDDDTSTSNLQVTINYTRDTNNFFDTQEKRDLLALAADMIVSRFEDDLAAIESGGGNTWEATFFDPATGNLTSIPNMSVAANELIIFAGGRDLGSALGFGGPAGYSGSGTQNFLNNLASRGEAGALEAEETDFGPWGGSMTFNTTANWHFDESTVGLENDENDFFSVALHELAHMLGFGTADSWSTYVDEVNNNFTGPASVLAYGEAVPLSGGIDDFGHWAADTLDGAQETAMDPELLQGTRKVMTDLDFAGLADVGWEVTGLATTTATITGSVFSDVNGDGDIDLGETGIEGVNVDLYRDNNNNDIVDDGDTLVTSDLTDNTGTYTFSTLEAGDYVVLVNDTGNVLTNTTATSFATGVAVTLVDDQTFTSGNFGFQALPAVSIAATDASASEAGDTATFTVTRTGPTTDALDVSYTIAGTASNGTDYQTITGTVTIAAGESTGTIVITPIDDDTNEGAESVLLTVVVDDPQTYQLGDTTSALAEIADDDVPTIFFTADNLTASEDGDTASYTVTRIGSTEGDLAVFYTVSGTATNGSDYQTLSGTVVIPDGSSSAQIVITPIDDDIDDDDETVLITITPNGSYSIGGATTNEVVITDNDDAEVLPLVAIDVVELYAIEGGRSAQVVFSRTGASTDEPLEVAFNVAGTAFDTVDYQSISVGGLGVVTIPAGQSSVTLDIVPIDDAITESPEETVVLTLAVDDAYAIDSENDDASVFIVDSDQTIPFVLVEKISDASEENTVAGTFRISRLGTGQDELLVSFLLGGTALLGMDYSSSQFSSVAIPQGQEFVDVVITPVDDATAEGSENVTIQLLAGGSYQLTVAASGATMLIIDSSSAADAQISGVKFEDINGNGVQDEGEPGLAGITITLDGPGVDTQTLTNGNGAYSFEALVPGSYTVEEIMPNGLAASTPTTVQVTLSASETETVNFGNYTPGIIAGIKFNDINGNGTLDENETGVQGVTITLDGPGGTQTTTTASDGTYSFITLAPGDYTVSETVPAGTIATTPVSVDLLVISGSGLAANFGNRVVGGAITGLKFHDLNANGILDQGEPGLEGVSITITGEGVNTTVLTGEDGSFELTGLQTGDYVVTEAVPDGFIASTPTTVNVSVEDPGVTQVAFGNYTLGVVTGSIFIDLDGDGTRDGNEPGQADVAVTLTRGDDTFNLITDASGNYTLTDAVPGTYTATQTVPDTFFASTVTTVMLDAVSGETVTADAMGNFQTGSISGVKFVDVNADGVIDESDTLFTTGATIVLVGPDGTQQIVTSEVGAFLFDDLNPGTYTLSELPTEGFIQTFPLPSQYTIELVSGQDVASMNFANASTDDLLLDFGDAPASFPTLSADNGASHLIGSGLFLGNNVDAEADGQPGALALGDDLNGNDDEDGVTFDTPLVAGQTAQITVVASAAGKLDAWIDFNNDGTWSAEEQIATSVDLTAGDNVLTFDVPADAVLTASSFARFRVSSAGDLAPGGLALDGEVEDYRVEIQAAGSISGVVFTDTDGDGVQDAGELGLEDVIVFIDVDNNGALDSSEPTATTAADGSYSFVDLPPGDYTVVQVVPGGMSPTVPDDGTQVVTVDSGQVVTGVTFGNEFSTPRPDLVGAFIGDGLTDEVVPGDKFNLEINVTNSGTTAASGKTTIKVYLVADGDELDTNAEPVATINANIKLDAGQSKSFKGKFEVPDTAPQGGFRLVAVVDADDAIDESNEGNNLVTSDESTVVYKVGEVGDRTVKKLTIDGVTYQISGAGTATVIPGAAGQAPSILVEGTDSGSQLKVKAGKDATSEINDVTVTGSLKKIDLSKFTLLGDILVSGTVEDIRLGDAEGQNLITIQNAGLGETLSLRAAQVRDLSIASAMPIKQIQVDDWDDTDAQEDLITAPSLEQIKSKSDLGTSITLTDISTELKKVDVKGSLLGSVIRTRGDISQVTAGRIVNSSIFAGVADDVTGLPDESSDFINGASIGQVQAKGEKGSTDPSFENSRIAASIVGKVKLSDVDFDNGGVDFGIAADTRIDQVDRADADKVGPVLTTGIADEQGDYIVRVV